MTRDPGQVGGPPGRRRAAAPGRARRAGGRRRAPIAAPSVAGVQHVPDGTGARDDEVGGRQRGGQLGQRHGLAADRGGDPLGVARASGWRPRPWRHPRGRRRWRRARSSTRRRRRAPRCRRADRALARPRPARRSPASGRPGRCRSRCGPACRPAGPAGPGVELAAGRPGVLGAAQGDPDLAEDLALADDHRVQPAGHREQVLDGAVLVVHVEVRGELLERRRRCAGRAARRSARRPPWNLSTSA